ncbi:hypothetical protein [Dysgonomonas sp. ZJ279]|nr:hypothetical protein [Dysgonomonas sp. ZJ279]
MLLTTTTSSFLKTKAQNEIQWISKVKDISENNFVVIPWNEVVE